MLTSYNGWPASKDPAEIGIKSYPVPGTKIKLRCAEAVAPLLVGFAAEFHALIEPIDFNNHLIDAARYLALMKLQERNSGKYTIMRA